MAGEKKHRGRPAITGDDAKVKISARVSKPVRDHLTNVGLGNLSHGVETVTTEHMRRVGKKPRT